MAKAGRLGSARTRTDVISEAVISRAGTDILDTTFAHALRLFGEDRLVEAESVCRSLLRLAPNHPEIVHLLAAIACRSPETSSAVALARRAVASDTSRSLFLNTLGVALRLAGRGGEAALWFMRALSLDRLAAEPRLNLGGVLADRRDPRASREMRRALVLVPGSAEAQNNLGALAVRKSLLSQGMARFGRALAIHPQHLDAWRNLSGAATWQGRIGGALAAARRALALAPADAEAQDMLGNALVALGDARGAQPPLRRAFQIRPDFHAAGSNLLFALAYDGGVSLEALAAERRAWAWRVSPRTGPFANDRDPTRRLRVGYLSGDLRMHPVGWNVEGLFRHRDRAEAEVCIYSTLPLPDETTEAFASMADRFTDVSAEDDAAVSRIIRDDRVDLLIALAPHTAYNSAVVLAEKPAPVVVAFHAIGSTGLPTVDHWVTDAILHPEDTAEPFTESLLRLPSFYLHMPPAASPEPGPPPSATTGAVTFGSFSNPAKLTPEVVSLWARVLTAVPGSRLLLRSGNRFGDPLVGERYRRLFSDHGIAAERLVFDGGQLSRADHLAMFDRVDVSLDPFPFNGSTTTFESLWMGVPVVTKIGDRFVGRVGLDVLTQVDLADLAADDDDAYVAIAAALAADAGRRAELRAGLRARLLRSVLCDAPAYARAFEAAMRQAWRRWCEAS